MAGNAREWLVNATGELRYTVGGWWKDDRRVSPERTDAKQSRPSGFATAHPWVVETRYSPHVPHKPPSSRRQYLQLVTSAPGGAVSRIRSNIIGSTR